MGQVLKCSLRKFRGFSSRRLKNIAKNEGLKRFGGNSRSLDLGAKTARVLGERNLLFLHEYLRRFVWKSQGIAPPPPPTHTHNGEGGTSWNKGESKFST